MMMIVNQNFKNLSNNIFLFTNINMLNLAKFDYIYIINCLKTPPKQKMS